MKHKVLSFVRQFALMLLVIWTVVSLVTLLIEIVPGDGPPVRGSDAVFAAVAAAAWLHAGRPTDWPTGTRWR